MVDLELVVLEPFGFGFLVRIIAIGRGNGWFGSRRGHESGGGGD